MIDIFISSCTKSLLKAVKAYGSYLEPKKNSKKDVQKSCQKCQFFHGQKL